MSLLHVGNDVVDMTDPRTRGRASDERFVARVFATSERELVEAAKRPDLADLEVWCLWAAKEAGFKALSKQMGSIPPFVHRRFRVDWCHSEARAGDQVEEVIREGVVTYEEHRARVRASYTPGRVHAVAFGRADAGADDGREWVETRVELLDAPGSVWAGTLEDLTTRFTERELDAVYSLHSAAVRLGARADLSKRLNVAEDRLEVVCAPGPTGQRPPRVLLDGEQADADVSLSHDGRWIAWATWVDETPGDTA